jgi:HB1/ASXL restriction endonuclease-like protein with HTH domain
MSATKTKKKSKPAKPKGAAKDRAETPPAAEKSTEKKLSALDAAAKVLGEAKEAMTCPELIAAMAEKGYWSSPHGLTPAATLYSAILREVKTKGKESRFAKTERGRFALKK